MIILGSTGSIGTQTLEVIAHLNSLGARGEGPRFEVVGLAARSNARLLLEQAAKFGVRDVALCRAGGDWPEESRHRAGDDAAERLVREVECDLVVAAMVGVAGLPATLAGVELGRDIALANKETLVAAGALVIPAARKSGSRLLPVDSEHSGVWQALGTDRSPPMECGEEVARVTLTASGGPFRTWTADQIARATPAQALKHPTWSMGPKVTIDSASLMNKALELIEAHWLFGLPAGKLGAVIHPQSIVHALVEYADGSVVAQLGAPDMRLPIQVALAHPARVGGVAGRVDLAALGRLQFEPVDPQRFPALSYALRVIEMGGTSGAALNAANEAAVGEFLASAERGRTIPFGRIIEIAGGALEESSGAVYSLEDVMRADDRARQVALSRLRA